MCLNEIIKRFDGGTWPNYYSLKNGHCCLSFFFELMSLEKALISFFPSSYG